MSIRSLVLRRLLIGLVLPGGLAAAVLLPHWSELPDEVAVHWGTSGAPDNFASPAGAALLLVALLVVLAALSAGIALTTPRTGPGARWAPAAIEATTWGLTAMITSTLLSQRAGDPAPDLRGWWFLAGLAAAALGLALGALGPTTQAPPRRTPVPADAPRLPDAPAGALWWSGRAPMGGATVAVVVVLVLLGVVLGWTAGWWFGAIEGAAALLVLLLGSARVTIGSARVVVAGGLAGWPRIRVDLESVTRAEASETRIRSWGGVGLRVRPGASGYITRGGEALELHRTDDTRVVITVDDAATAAATVNTLLARTG